MSIRGNIRTRLKVLSEVEKKALEDKDGAILIETRIRMEELNFLLKELRK